MNLANSIRIRYSEKEGLPARSKTLVALASGLDVAVTVLEESVGSFKGLTPERAKKVCDYFRTEAKRSERIDRETAIFYLAWADALDQLFIMDQEL